MKKITFALVCVLITTSISAKVAVTIATDNRINHQWVNYELSTGTYDINCREVSRLVKIWDTTINGWMNLMQFNHFFNPSGTYYQDSEIIWNQTTSSWGNYYRVTDTYDVSNNLTGQSQDLWDSAAASWIRYYRISYVNNADGSHHIAYNQVWTGSIWNTLTTAYYTYGIPGRLDTILYQQQTSPGIWRNSQMITYVYNTTGGQTSQETDNWNTTTNSWDKSQLQLYIPDLTQPDSLYIERWNSTTTGWDTSYRQVFTYTDCSTAAVPGMESTKEMTVYPNPSNGTFSIDLGRDATANAVVFIADVLGKTLLQHPITEQTTMIQSRLPKGIYFLTIINGGERISKKIVVE